MTKVNDMTGRIVLLNALPLTAIPYDTSTILVKQLSMERFKEEIRDFIEKGYEVISYIRHKATVDLLEKMLNIKLNVSSELYKFSENDLVYVVTLAPEKIQRGQEMTSIELKDLVFYYVVIVKGAWI
jgi:hypothetical protein